MLLITSISVKAAVSKTVLGFGLSGGTASVDLELGTSMVVTLETNPSTGYDWELEGALPSCLSMKSVRTLKASDDSSSRVGTPITKEIVYDAVGTCQTELRFVYIRPWLDEPEVEQRATIHVTVSRKEY